ncbi:MAG: hypothetical protein ACYSWS_06145 [Planctomycetota bacterium]|jgi:hypothetical protein
MKDVPEDDFKLLEFVIENPSEMMWYISKGNTNIRIHRDINGEVWCGVRDVRYYEMKSESPS